MVSKPFQIQIVCLVGLSHGLKAFFWGFLGLNFSTDKFFCKTNS